MDEREEHVTDWKLHFVVRDRERIVSEITTPLPIYEENKKNLTRTCRSDPNSLSPKHDTEDICLQNLLILPFGID